MPYRLLRQAKGAGRCDENYRDPFMLKSAYILKNVIAALTGAVLIVLGFMFSLVIITAIAVVGLAAWGYLMWKTRKTRRAMREQAPSGNVIDGEAVVVEISASNNTLPEQRSEE
jgi:type III secretory pathway component EscU